MRGPIFEKGLVLFIVHQICALLEVLVMESAYIFVSSVADFKMKSIQVFRKSTSIIGGTSFHEYLNDKRCGDLSSLQKKISHKDSFEKTETNFFFVKNRLLRSISIRHYI